MHQRHEKTLLIHGFSPVNARLLTVYGTAFYAITLISLNYPCHEHIFMVPKMFEPLKFNCNLFFLKLVIYLLYSVHLLKSL